MEDVKAPKPNTPNAQPPLSPEPSTPKQSSQPLDVGPANPAASADVKLPSQVPPTPQVPSSDSDQVPQTESDLVPAPAPPAEELPPGLVNSQSKAKKTSPNRPKLLIAVAVVVALILAGAAVFMYLQGNQTSPGSTTASETTEQQADSTTPAQDVNSLSTEIDSSLEQLDDAESFPEDELSDETLGL